MKKLLCFIALLFFGTAYAQSYDSLLQTKARDVRFAELLAELDLDSPTFTTKIKTGTTSVGLKVLKNDKNVAHWYPKGNLSMEVEGQVVSYNLARFLEMSELVAPSDYYSISGKHLDSFVELIDGTLKENSLPDFQHSLTAVLAEAQKHQADKTALPGVMHLKIDHFEPTELVFWEKNQFNRDHAIAKMIRAENPQPSFTRILDLPGYVPEDAGEVNIATEQELADELSQLMVLDMLAGQRDRFSGGNIEALFDKSEENKLIGKLHFIFRDNSASSYFYTDIDDVEFLKYKSIVTRFNREQIKRIELLVKLINTDAASMQKTLKMTSDTSYLLRRSEAVLKHVQTQVDTYGEDKVYFK
jgi:hypothetical protein